MNVAKNHPSGIRRSFARFGRLLLSIIFVMLGIAALFNLGIQLRDWNLYRASRTWPGVTGMVTESKLVELYSQEGTEYMPVIVYVYSVAGRQFENREVRFGSGSVPPSFHSRSEPESLVAKYPAGSKVIVYYNPDHPGLDSVLQREFKPDWFLTAQTGLLVIVAVLVGGSMALNFGKHIYSKVESDGDLA